jgi:ABC-type transport system substrate-binding protein
MRDGPSSWRRGLVSLLLACLLGIATLFLGLASQPTVRGAPAESEPAARDLGDLERQAAHAPPAIAALYRALARPSGEDYEQRALTAIERFLKEGEAAEVPPLAGLRAAETALVAVLRFHAAHHPRPLAEANSGTDVAKRLNDRLLEVRRQQLGVLAGTARSESDWTAALRQAGQWLEVYPEDKELRAEAAALQVRYAAARLKEKDYPAVRRGLATVVEGVLRRPENRKLLQEVREQLRAAAQVLVREAGTLPDQAAAVSKLQEAQALWPELPGLEDELLRRKGAYTILYVGVPDLPENLSPATAWTLSERLAVELLFETLAEPRYDSRLGQVYHPQLAAAAPTFLPGGRRFRLAHDGRWSDGRPVTSLDVRNTSLLLRANGRAPEWEDLLEEPRVEDDPYRIDFPCRQLPFDPLARLAFKVLPQSFRGQALTRAVEPAFAREPLGSGPFRYAGRKTEAGRTYAVFTANPHYHRPGRPHVREIRFFVSADPVADFRRATPPLHLLMDVPADRYDALAAAGARDLRTLPNRCVYFLAVNHRVTALEDPNLRRALALAIHREQILNDRFRGSSVDIHWWNVKRRVRHPGFHQALNGPYPARSWAVSPSVDADVRLKLVPLPPRQLKQAVDRHDYELAYFHHVYDDESYWLWPLFDTRAEALQPGGSNFLGYKNDGTLETLFRKAMGEREFARLQEKTHAIHAHLNDKMPLIPLWQLDTHVAVHPDLAAVGIETLPLFATVEEWTLKR